MPRDDELPHLTRNGERDRRTRACTTSDSRLRVNVTIVPGLVQAYVSPRCSRFRSAVERDVWRSTRTCRERPSARRPRPVTPPCERQDPLALELGAALDVVAYVRTDRRPQTRPSAASVAATARASVSNFIAHLLSSWTRRRVRLFERPQNVPARPTSGCAKGTVSDRSARVGPAERPIQPVGHSEHVAR